MKKNLSLVLICIICSIICCIDVFIELYCYRINTFVFFTLLLTPIFLGSFLLWFLKIQKQILKLGLFLFFIALALLGPTFLLVNCQNSNNNTVNNIVNILIGIGTNIIGIIITIMFVNYVLDEQAKSEQQRRFYMNEISFDYLFGIYLNKYLEFFNCIVIPESFWLQGEVNYHDINTDINGYDIQINLLYDLFNTPCFSSTIQDSAILLFFEHENNLSQLIEEALKKGIYDEEISKILRNFLNAHKEFNSKKIILQDSKYNQKKIIDELKKLPNNLFANHFNECPQIQIKDCLKPYCALANMLDKEAKAICNYEECIEKVRKEIGRQNLYY